MENSFDKFELTPELLEAVSGGAVDSSQETTILNILRRSKEKGASKEAIVYFIKQSTFPGSVLYGVTAEEIDALADAHWDEF